MSVPSLNAAASPLATKFGLSDADLNARLAKLNYDDMAMFKGLELNEKQIIAGYNTLSPDQQVQAMDLYKQADSLEREILGLSPTAMMVQSTVPSTPAQSTVNPAQFVALDPQPVVAQPITAQPVADQPVAVVSPPVAVQEVAPPVVDQAPPVVAPTVNSAAAAPVVVASAGVSTPVTTTSTPVTPDPTLHDNGHGHVHHDHGLHRGARKVKHGVENLMENAKNKKPDHPEHHEHPEHPDHPEHPPRPELHHDPQPVPPKGDRPLNHAEENKADNKKAEHQIEADRKLAAIQIDIDRKKAEFQIESDKKQAEQQKKADKKQAEQLKKDGHGK